MTKTLTFWFCILTLYSLGLRAQTITSTPTLPTASDSVTIVFNATGTPLENYTGTVYTHTGVILEGSSSWQYVIGTWGNNSTQPGLTRISANTYQLKITPSVKAFYSTPSSAVIKKMAFVFRNSTANAQTGNLYIDVVAEGITVKITSPTLFSSLFEINQPVNVQVAANGTETLSLYVNQTQVQQTTQNNISYQFTTTQYGTHWIKAVGTTANNTVADSLAIYVRRDVTISSLPAEVKPGINYTETNEITLVLHDPPALKSFVFAIGDHSNWMATDQTYMNRTPDGKHYWITLSNLDPNREYIYQYWIDGQLRLADPYTDKVSDPWNDKNIPNTTYPNLIAYPEGKTTGIASVFRTQPEAYVWQTTNFTPPPKENLIIYELHIRDFVESSDIKEVRQKLDYLHDLGINVIELMPVNEFEGNDSWGYNPSFYFAPDKAYGTKNDYKQFIDECHARGIAVIIDMVLNHSFGQSPFVQMYFNANAGQWGQPTAQNPWYNETCPHQPWCWGYDFNHASPHTQELIDRINRYWLEEFKVDGFRFDFTKGFTNNQTDNQGSNYDSQRIFHLKRMADQIWQVNPNAYVILEHFCENSEEKELAEYRANQGKGMLIWGNMNYNYNEATMGWLSNSNFSGISYKARGWTVPHLVGYMESHDEERLMYKNLQYGNSSNPSHNVKNLNIALKRCELAAAFFFTIPGPKMIWQFGELGYDVSIDYNGRTGRKPVRWYYMNDPLRWNLHNTYAKLIHLRRRYPVFSTNDFQTSLSGAQKFIVLIHPNMKAVVIGNFDIQQANVAITFPATGTWYEFFTQDSISISAPAQSFTFAPGEYRLYTSQRIVTDSVYTVGITKNQTKSEDYIKIYPNPTSSGINLQINATETEKAVITLYDLTGRLLITQKETIFPGFNSFRLERRPSISKGIYLLKIKTKTLGEFTSKVIFE